MEIQQIMRILLEDPDPYIRIYCLKRLGQEGGGDSVREAIISCLRSDSDPIVRHEAAFWLGEMGDPEATQALAEAAVKDTSPLVRHECVEALGWIPTEASKKALQKALQDRDEAVRKTAEISLDIHRNPREKWESQI